MRPSARRNSQRGIKRSRAPSSNNQRAGDTEVQSISAAIIKVRASESDSRHRPERRTQAEGALIPRVQTLLPFSATIPRFDLEYWQGFHHVQEHQNPFQLRSAGY